MKLVMLTYLEGDEKCVDRMLVELGVTSFTRMAVEDPRHPIRAFLLGVEDAAACRCQHPAEAESAD